MKASLIYRFIADCKQAGRKVMVWTVNEPNHMIEVGVTKAAVN